MKKTCKLCKGEFSIDDFYVVEQTKEKTYYSGYCKTCQKQKSKDYRLKKRCNKSVKKDQYIQLNNRECRKILEYIAYSEEYTGDALSKEVNEIKDKIYIMFPELKEFSLANQTYEVIEEVEVVTHTGKKVKLYVNQIIYNDTTIGYDIFSLTDNFDCSELFNLRDASVIQFYGL